MCVFVLVFVCVSSYCNAFTSGGLFSYFWSTKAQKTPLSPLRVNHAMDYSIIVPHKLVTDRRFYSFASICPQKLFNSLQKQTPGRKDSENPIHFNQLFHTLRCNIFTNIYNDKYKKAIPTNEDNSYSSILVIIILIFCTIIAIWMNGAEHWSPLFMLQW